MIVICFSLQVLIFIGEVALCLNWAIIADILLVSIFLYPCDCLR